MNKTDSVAVLRECPFCGGAAEFERMGSPRQSCIVACTECGARHESSEEYEECGTAWNRRAPGGEVTEALRAVLPYVATTAVGCHGDKCREPWCYSCFGEEAADEAASKAREAYYAAHAALAARTGKPNVPG